MTLDVLAPNRRSIAPSKRVVRPSYAGPQRREAEFVFLYVVQCGRFTKIGISHSPKRRAMAMQGDCPYPIRLVESHSVALDLAPTAERRAMVLLDSAHHHGEWFKCPVADAIYAVRSVIAAIT